MALAWDTLLREAMKFASLDSAEASRYITGALMKPEREGYERWNRDVVVPSWPALVPPLRAVPGASAEIVAESERQQGMRWFTIFEVCRYVSLPTQNAHRHRRGSKKQPCEIRKLGQALPPRCLCRCVRSRTAGGECRGP